jgi:leucyl-tRNA synthetase
VALLNFLNVLQVFAPHVAEELLVLCGSTGEAALAPWPQPPESGAKPLVISVQVNGKHRVTLQFAAGSTPSAEDIATNPEVQKYLKGTITKTVYVAGRFANFICAE